MSSKSKLVVLAVVAVLALMTVAGSSGAAEPYSDWITVDRVLVNKLGGVNVSGEVSCAGTYDDLMAGLFQAVNENEEWYTVAVPGSEDKVNIFVNADQYTVSQPAGRRLMIQVEHGSSRMTPCYAQHPYDMNGTAWTDFGVQCRPDGTACRWETDRFAYDRVKHGPLFDYSPNGKFKAGSLNVDAYAYGALVMIYDTVTKNWESHYSPYAADIFTSQVVRATMYR
jgi:hypothetical protein